MSLRIALALLAVSLPAGAVAQPSAAARGAERSVEQLIRDQVRAWNSNDVDAWAAFYTDDAELFTLGEPVPFARGRAAIIEQYRPFFAEYRPRATIKKRIVLGQFVTDHERDVIVGETRESIVTYEVVAGRIRRVWFAEPAE